ncbi:MAG: SDR family oxidoreductase [Hamadaea sp.]|uniref:SDR family oxidoreductase n=1 Tax=Glycomyces artemisiae TaxID=1076443 RepID=A0A850CBE9_9ACTN|nr:SDR family oxidoreductase [Hamadaea sp.]NUQ88450.1 SDR family oxidoreductase [Glycomyces artemisiae]NUT36480.1 SDR family oxidoreductase [Hamadaea sp.]
MGQLEGKVAVITGATSGIGEAMARRYAEEGADLVVNGRRTDRGEALAAELRRDGTRVEVVTGDAADAGTATAIAERARAVYGRIDVLALNAGVITYASLWDIDEEDVDAMLAVNLKSPWLVAKACHRLISDGGSVIVTASVSSFDVYPGEGIYGMTKAGALHLAKAMAQELAPRRIRVNALCPGFVGEAGMAYDAINTSEDPEALTREYIAVTPLGRACTMREVTDSAVFLAGDMSTFMTGTSLVLDGGLLVAP